MYISDDPSPIVNLHTFVTSLAIIISLFGFIWHNYRFLDLNVTQFGSGKYY